jgi:branched-chain amino acid transport system permease protein
MIQFLAYGVCSGFALSLVALGFGLIYYSTRVFHFAHGATYAIAAYSAYYLIGVLKLSILPAVAVALVVAALSGLLAEWVIYWPLHRRKGSQEVLMISSLGAYVIVVNAIALLTGNDSKVLRPGVEQSVDFGSFILTRIQILQVVVGMIAMTGLWAVLRWGRTGHLWRALADNPDLLAVLGINERRARSLVFAAGSALCGLGAVLNAMDVGIDPQIGMGVVLAAAVACIVGGLKRFLAPVAGAMVLGLLQNLAVWRWSSEWQPAITYGLLVVFLLLRPQGLLGQRRRLEEG